MCVFMWGARMQLPDGFMFWSVVVSLSFLQSFGRLGEGASF